MQKNRKKITLKRLHYFLVRPKTVKIESFCFIMYANEIEVKMFKKKKLHNLFPMTKSSIKLK